LANNGPDTCPTEVIQAVLWGAGPEFEDFTLVNTIEIQLF